MRNIYGHNNIRWKFLPPLQGLLGKQTSVFHPGVAPRAYIFRPFRTAVAKMTAGIPG